MKFRLLLLFVYFRLVWLSRNDVAFQEKIAGRSLVFVFGASDRAIYRHYRLTDGRIESRRGMPERYDLSLEFKTAGYGYRMLTEKTRDPLSFAKGMNKREIELRGKMEDVFWLIGVGKHLPLKRKKAKSKSVAPATGRMTATY